jgi:hypothetical protein
MDPSKERSGCTVVAISVIGEIITRRVSEFSSFRMATSTRACGVWINDMDKARTGASRWENLEENIPATGLRIKSMVGELSSIRMAIVTMDIG